MNGNTTKRVVVDAGHGGYWKAQNDKWLINRDMFQKIIEKILKLVLNIV